MELFVDFEGFYSEYGDFIIKELAAISLTDGLDTAVLKMFGPPECKEQFRIIETKDFWQKTHTIRMKEGSTPYSNVGEVLMEIVEGNPYDQYIYVLGEEKKHFLKDICDPFPIIDLSKMPFVDHMFSFVSDKPCLYKKKHLNTSDYACAFETVQKMRKWFISCWGPNPLQRKSLQIFYQLRNLTKMHHQDIACLDEKFILKHAHRNVNLIWSKLPPRMQMDPKVIELTSCNEHFNSTDGIAINGPNPLRKNCKECKKLKSLVC